MHPATLMQPAAVQAGLKFAVAMDYEFMSREATRLIMTELKRRRDLLLCVSAGGTPSRAYELLAEQRRRNPRLFARLRLLQIDEWLGMASFNPASCKSDLERKLVGPLGITPQRFISFDSGTADPRQECGRVSNWLKAHGPIDLCILGLGINGHVAMNEPGRELIPHVHIAKLAPSSRQHALLSELSPKPQHGLTLGLGDILRSRKILLLVSGRAKRKALQRLRKPCVTPEFPASFLWLHGDATVICDRPAAGA